MTSVLKILSSAALATAIGVGALAASAGTASAYVVCNSYGDCWHTDHRYHYGWAPQYHPDDWYFHHDWHADDRYHWRDWHEGRGYYRSGVWVPF